MSYKYRGKFRVGKRIYKRIASNFLLDFVPKESLYVKNNSSNYELNPIAALGVPCMDYGAEGLKQ
jgi:hypothetical protein